MGALSRVYGRVYEIHSMLWHPHKKHMRALGKVREPSENLIFFFFLNQTTYQVYKLHVESTHRVSPHPHPLDFTVTSPEAEAEAGHGLPLDSGAVILALVCSESPGDLEQAAGLLGHSVSHQ